MYGSKTCRIAAEKLLSAKKFKRNAIQTEVLPNVTILKLHGNSIAYLYNDPERTLSIDTTGWFTKTTKTYLNALPGVSIHQKNWVWYLNGEEWDGRLTDVCKLYELNY